LHTLEFTLHRLDHCVDPVDDPKLETAGLELRQNYIAYDPARDGIGAITILVFIESPNPEVRKTK
jgi:hypothetical protein